MTANSIHPTAIIGDDVQLGEDNVIGPYVVLEGPLEIGNGNWIGTYCHLGGQAQWSGMRGHEMDAMQRAGIRIGDGNVLREYVSVHHGTERPTTVGDGVYLMAHSHVPHDALIMDSTTLTNAVQLAGHTQIGWRSNLGMGTVVHQRTVIGAYVMLGMQSVVTRDIPPGALAYGSPARVRGANKVGLSRAGFDESTIEAIDAALREGRSLPDDGPFGEAVTWFESKVATARP